MSPGASKSSDNMMINFMLGGVSGGISKVLDKVYNFWLKFKI